MKLKWVYLYLIAFGAVFLGLGIWFYVDQRDFMAKASKATGTVISVKRETSRSTSGSTSITYRPVIAFEAGGKRYTFHSNATSPSYRNYKGRDMAVLYDPSNPRDARLAGGIVPLLPAIFMGIGAVVVLLGTLLPIVFKVGKQRSSA